MGTLTPGLPQGPAAPLSPGLGHSVGHGVGHGSSGWLQGAGKG